MRKHDLNRVEFFSKEDLSAGYHLSKAETILRDKIKPEYKNLNDVLELYNIKKYIDNGVYLKSWSKIDIEAFKQKVIKYGIIIGRSFAKINDENVITHYNQLFSEYINSFWELINSHKIYKQISSSKIAAILQNEPDVIWIVLNYKMLATHYNTLLKEFLLTYTQSAEILLSFYERKDDFNKKAMFLPNSLTIQDKEKIISKYLDSNNVNINYCKLILNARIKDDFRISDKIRLKAKRLYENEIEKIFDEKEFNSILNYGVSITFPENTKIIKEKYIENHVINYSYSLDFIKQNLDDYSLYLNFKLLFEFIDAQNIIDLINKENQMGVIERHTGIHSKNEYQYGIEFDLSEKTSLIQVFSYSKIINDLGKSLENVLQNVFTTIFHKKYNFAKNARLSLPLTDLSYFEKVRLLAPEFESTLKQYKLFVEEGSIDFELLQISSTPCSINKIPSLVRDKYIYIQKNNKEILGCSTLFFSDQTSLTYVEPHKNKHYSNLFDLLANEEVSYNKYKDYQKARINFLVDNGFIHIDKNNILQITNIYRVLILKDLYENEVSSFYHFPIDFQNEAKEMFTLNMISFESSLFSKPEQSYFNYYLNKSEFVNGLDLRNSYLHGTQANSDEVYKHENSYFAYLKLLILVLLKIEDDLLISHFISNN